MFWRVTFILVIVLTEASAFAAEFRCNRKQTKCSVENVRLTIGDRIGILNEDRELVATAEVDGIQGRHRKLVIREKHGKIYNGYQVARLDNEESYGDMEKSYRIFKPSSDTQITALAEIASLSVGEGVFSYGAQGYYESKLKKYIYWTGRGYFLTGSGNIRPVENSDVSVINASTFGAMGGIAYKTKRQGDFVFRSEAALGFGYVMADIDGEASYVDERVDQMSNGLGLATRLEFQAIYQGMDWSPAFVGSYGLIHSAKVGTVGLALSKALD